MAAWPPIGGGRMMLYGKHHHPLGLSGSHAGCDVLSYSQSALETLGGEPRSLSEPPEAVRTSRYYLYLGCGGAGHRWRAAHGAFYSTISLPGAL